MEPLLTTRSLLRLLQLVSPTLPIGAYSYSEGLETLVHQGTVTSAQQLEHWLHQELRYGAIRVEAAILVRAYRCAVAGDWPQLRQWNDWLSAFRETEELREQSWQMGRSLAHLLLRLEPELAPAIQTCGETCNTATAVAIAAAHWQIACEFAVLGYLQTWLTNLIGAGVRLIPLGQTTGQQLLLDADPVLHHTAAAVLHLPDAALDSCGWGLAIASMTHETLYSRLFRS